MRDPVGGFVLVVAAACGGPGDRTSGDRLKPMWEDFGGPRTFVGFFDAARNEFCSPRLWSDGNTYCSPSGGSVAYADARCQELVGTYGITSDCSAILPDYFEEAETGSCRSAVARMFTRGAKLDTEAVYFRGRDGSCQGPYPEPGFQHFHLGVEIRASAFARLTRAVTDSGGRLSQRWLVSGDTEVPDGMFDAELGVDCAMSPAGDRTTGTCGPIDAVYVSTYEDEACSRGEVEEPTGCRVPALALQPSASTCPGGERYFRVGSRIAPSTVYIGIRSTAGDYCTAEPPTPAAAYYALGDEVSTARLPRVLDPASGSVVQQFHYVDGTTTYPDDYVFYDSQHRTECYGMGGSDGVSRCVPVSYPVLSRYTDPSCFSSIKVIGVPTQGSCSAPELRFATESYLSYSENDPSTCKATFNVYTLGAVYTDPLYDLSPNSPTRCAPVASDAMVFHSLGELHPIDEFPVITLVRDP